MGPRGFLRDVGHTLLISTDIHELHPMYRCHIVIHIVSPHLDEMRTQIIIFPPHMGGEVPSTERRYARSASELMRLLCIGLNFLSVLPTDVSHEMLECERCFASPLIAFPPHLAGKVIVLQSSEYFVQGSCARPRFVTDWILASAACVQHYSREVLLWIRSTWSDYQQACATDVDPTAGMCLGASQ